MTATIRSRLLSAVQEAYRRYISNGARSTSKIKALHGWVISELQQVLGDEYDIRGLSDSGGKEAKIEGKYYTNKVDVSISRNDIQQGVVSVKFVMTNYRQNKNNYFEQQLGKTANLRRNDIVFGHIMLLTNPTPYLKKGGEVKKYEYISDKDIQLYESLSSDHGQPHVPDIQCMAIFLLSTHEGEIVRQCTEGDMPEVSETYFHMLDTTLSIDRFFERMCGEIENKYLKKQEQQP